VSALAWLGLGLGVWLAISAVIMAVAIRKAPVRDDWD